MRVVVIKSVHAFRAGKREAVLNLCRILLETCRPFLGALGRRLADITAWDIRKLYFTSQPASTTSMVIINVDRSA